MPFRSLSLALPFVVLTTAAAQAGTVVAIGDNNMTDNLPTDAATSQFFTNLLGDGTNVGLLAYDIPNYDASIDNTDDELATHFKSIGASVTSIDGALTSSLLDGLDLFIAAMPDDIFDATEVDALGSFLDMGGTAVFMGDNAFNGFMPANMAIYQVLQDLGSGMRYNAMGIGINVANAAPDATFADQAPAVRFVSGSSITGGTAEYRVSNLAVVASASVGITPVPGPASLPLLATACLAGWALRRRTKPRA